MDDINILINTYKEQLEKGHIQKAFQYILQVIMEFKNDFQKAYPEYNTAAQMQYGQLDMTYFTFSPPELKAEKLKLALVFDHQNFQFEMWLVGQNKNIQKRYWTMFKDSDWNVYPLTDNPKHAIIQFILLQDPIFQKSEALKVILESEITTFTTRLIESIQFTKS